METKYEFLMGICKEALGFDEGVFINISEDEDNENCYFVDLEKESEYVELHTPFCDLQCHLLNSQYFDVNVYDAHNYQLSIKFLDQTLIDYELS